MNAYSIVKKIKSKRTLIYIENILNVLYRLIFYIIVPKEKKSLSPKTYYFSICAIFKNEAPFLKEWIEYNRLIGADHIYLYNNNSTDNYLDVLQNYMEEGYITLTNWPMAYGQMQAYEDCYKKVRNETTWLALFDIDEFVCPIIETNMKDFLQRYEGYPALKIYWQMFGTNGQLESQPGTLVTEQYTCGWKSLDGNGKVVLFMGNNFSPVRMYNHSIFFYMKFAGCRWKVPMITEHRRFCFFSDMIYLPPSKNTIQLNHYFSKSYTEFMRKIARGSAARQENVELRRKSSFFFLHEHLNVVEHKEIYRFMIELKLRMNGKDINYNN